MTDEPKKGTFSPDRLPVARAYAPRRSRRTMTLIGLAAAVLITGYAAWSLFLQSGEFVAGGPLTSAHSVIEAECSRCHRVAGTQGGLSGLRTGAIEDARCMECHGGSNREQGMYSLARHFVYARAETTGLADDLDRYAGQREDCATCHPEHRGRDAAMLAVTDANCVSCHPYRNFTEQHPEFDVVAESIPDDSTLIFTHTHHTQIIVDNYALANPCQFCHVPARDGLGFLPIRFEPHCGGCHMDGSDGTGLLQVATAEGQPGVQTLEAIKSGGQPGTYWAHLANPNEYFSLGPALVRKLKVVHRDPWILENLRFIRTGLYADLGIAGLLDTYGLASNESPAALYGEVANRLDQYASALNARGEQAVRQDLSVGFRNNLNRARKQIIDPGVFLPAAPFLSPYQGGRPGLTASRRLELLAVADSLTSACRLCHRIENAAIARVQKDQRALIRGRFDHRAHVLDMECFDCHNRIPLRLEDLTAYAESTKAANALPPERAALRSSKLAALRWSEREAIQNLPGIKVCVDCHRPGKATRACVTCHDYHPGKPSTGLVTGL